MSIADISYVHSTKLMTYSQLLFFTSSLKKITKCIKNNSMSESISTCVKQVINNSPFINEMLIQQVISYSNLSRFIQPKVEQLYGSSVKHSAIVMAVRRYSEELIANQSRTKREKINYEINMKTNIYDVNFVRSDVFVSRLSSLYDEVKMQKGDFLNVSIGSHEISLSVSDKFKDAVEEIIKGEEILHRKDNMVALTISFTGDFLQTPGILYMATRKLAWENINLTEIVSTMNELTFVIEKEDSIKAYDVLQSFFDEEI